MKTLTLTLLFFVLVSPLSASFSLPAASAKAADIMVCMGQDGKMLSLSALSAISLNDYEQLTAKKMHMPEKLYFLWAQHRLRKAINADGTVNPEKISGLNSTDLDGSKGFNFLGFVLGFVLSFIGVLIAYLIESPGRKNRIKWAWFGFGASILFFFLLFLAFFDIFSKGF
jgi:hypothetical protein